MIALLAAAYAQPPAIVNGVPATDSDFPEAVALVRGTTSFCTGSLIHPEWVLTAAHCFDEPADGASVAFGPDVTRPDARVDIAEVLVHPGYLRLEDAPDGRPHDDVALVRLGQPKDDAFVMALNPDPVDAGWLGLDVTFAGYGITADGGSGSGLRRFVDVPITGFDDATLFTWDGVHSTCQGDSGGPGVLRKGEAYVQVAVTSYGVECGAAESGAMRVDAYLPWITSHGIEVRTSPAAPPTLACSHEVSDGEALGVVPFELKCAIDYPRPSEITSVDWLFGDGGSGEGTTASHTYTEQGQYTVQACVQGVADGVSWEHCAYQPAYVRACDVPEPVFEIAPSELARQPLTYDLVNQTDVSTYGCVADLQWDVYAGSEPEGEPVATLGAGWSPRFTFPEPGVYTVVLHLGGVGGTGSAAATVDTRDVLAVGCSTAPGGAGFLVPLLVLALRRR